jgi:hypothetical protein
MNIGERENMLNPSSLVMAPSGAYNLWHWTVANGFEVIYSSLGVYF